MVAGSKDRINNAASTDGAVHTKNEEKDKQPKLPDLRPTYPEIDPASFSHWFSGLPQPQETAKQFFSYLSTESMPVYNNRCSSSNGMTGSPGTRREPADAPSLIQQAVKTASAPKTDETSFSTSEDTTSVSYGEDNNAASEKLYPEVEFFDRQGLSLYPLPYLGSPEERSDASAVRNSQKGHGIGKAGPAVAQSPARGSPGGEVQDRKNPIWKAHARGDSGRGHFLEDQESSLSAAPSAKSVPRKTTIPEPFHFEARAQGRPKSTAQVRHLNFPTHIIQGLCQS